MTSMLISSSPESRTLRNALRLMTTYGVFKLGEFTLKSGQRSPIYIDLRETFGHQDLMAVMCSCLETLIKKIEKEKPYIGIVGVPYAALPYASVVALQTEQPLLIIRKEAKAYGTKKLIEGTYTAGQRVIVVEDVVTTGASLKEVITTLRNEGLVVEDVFCILDREQGGPSNLSEMGVKLHSLLSMQQILAFLASVGKLSEEQFKDIITALSLSFNNYEKFDVTMDKEKDYVDGNGYDNEKENGHDLAVRLSLPARERLAVNPLSKRLLSLINTKATNLCLAVDYTDGEKILDLVDKAGPFVCAIKVHADTLDDFSESWTTRLVALANKHDFLIFEDRKYADTGNTLSLQVKKVAKWADVVTVYGMPGEPSIVSSIEPIINDSSNRLKGILLIAQLSTKGSLVDEKYTKAVKKIGEKRENIVCGFITQQKISDVAGLIHWTPGVSMDESSDGKGQQWRSVQQAIIEDKNDIVIVGRAICNKATPVSELRRYRDAAWEALSSVLPK